MAELAEKLIAAVAAHPGFGEKARQTPIVNVSVQGTPFPPIPVATGSLGVLLRPVLWLYRWLVRLATGK